MTSPSSPQEPLMSTPLLLAIHNLVTERDSLKSQVAILRSAVHELLLHANHLDELLLSTRTELAASGRLLTQDEPNEETDVRRWSIVEEKWLSGQWLSTRETQATMAEAETWWEKRDSVRALASLEHLFKSPRLKSSVVVNAMLLESAILRSTTSSTESDSDRIKRTQESLYIVEAALRVAEKHQLHDSVGKAQFFRGCCLFELGATIDAEWCFQLATWTKGYEKLVDGWKEVARRKKEEEQACGWQGLRWVSPGLEFAPKQLKKKKKKLDGRSSEAD